MERLAWLLGACFGIVGFAVKSVARLFKIIPPSRITGTVHRIFLKKGWPNDTYSFPKYISETWGTRPIKMPGHIMLVLKSSDYDVAKRGMWFQFEDETLRCVRRKFKTGHGGRRGSNYYIEFYRWPPQRIRSKR